MAHAGGNATRMGKRGRTCAVERAGDVDGAGDGVRAPQSHTARRGVREWAFDVMDAASHDEMNADIDRLTQEFSSLLQPTGSEPSGRRDILLRPHLKRVEFSDGDEPLELTESNEEEEEHQRRHNLRPRQVVSRPRRF